MRMISTSFLLLYIPKSLNKYKGQVIIYVQLDTVGPTSKHQVNLKITQDKSSCTELR